MYLGRNDFKTLGKLKIKHLLLLILACISWYQSSGQGSCFTLDKPSLRYCVGETVILTNCITPANASYDATAQYKYGDGTTDSPVVGASATITHVYNTPGTYTITQTGGRNNPPSYNTVDNSSQTITILPNVNPAYTVGRCENGVVKVTFTDGVYTTYTLNNSVDGDEVVPSTPPYQKQYAPPFTSKTITVKGECAGIGVLSTFTPIDKLISPDVLSQTAQSFSTGKDSASIILDAKPSMIYKVLQYTSGMWQPIDTLSGLTGLRTLPKYYTGVADSYFAVSTFDPCGAERISPTLCIPKLTGTAVSNINTLNWTPIPPMFQSELTSILVYRNDVIIATLLPSDISYIDNKIVCGRKYNYYLKIISNKNTLLNSKPVESNSAPVTLTAISSDKPPAVKNFNSSVEGNSINLTWDKPLGTVSFYTISRSDQGMPFREYNFSLYSSYKDGNVDVKLNRYCYKINLTDSCGNTSDDSLVTCPMLLSSQKSNIDQHASQWWEYKNGSSISPTYTMEVYDQSNKLINSYPMLNDTNFLFTEVMLDVPYYRYRVKVVEGTKNYYSNTTEIRNDILVFIPDAFTPNGDEDNPEFKIYGKYFKDYKLSIFNRWGELIFYSENKEEGWKGDYNGQPCLPGVYGYVFTATDNSKEPYIKKGTIILIK